MRGRVPHLAFADAGCVARLAIAAFLAYIAIMRRDDVIAKLKQTEPALRGFGVAALYLFGSHARDEAGPDSDVDVFIEVAPDATFGLSPYMAVYRVLEDAFEHNAEIGYSTRDALSPYIRPEAEREAVRIF
jgi:predicted nucleotidyltransferase